MRKLSFFFFFAFLLFSCNNKSSERAIIINEKGNHKIETEAKGELFSCKNTSVAASMPKTVIAAKPEIFAGFSNIHPAGIAEPRNIKGNLLEEAEVATAKTNFSKKAVGHPKVVKALQPAMREQNPLGLKFYDVSQGLPNSYIRCMLQDREGNIWFGTGGGGVCKFDGNDFFYFTEKEGLPNNFVVSMLQDREGNIWFGTDGGGACRFDGDSLLLLDEKSGLPNSNIWSMLEDAQGNIWLGSAGGGLCSYDGKTLKYFNKENGFFSDYIISMTKDKAGNLWFGSYGEGLCKYNGKNFTLYTDEEGLPGNVIQTLLADDKNNVWLGTDGGGVALLSGDKITSYTESNGLPMNSVNTLLQDVNGNIWIGTNGKGVCKFDGIAFNCFTEYEGLSGAEILSLLQDRNGNLWFGTSGHGVTKYDKNCFTHFSKKEGLSNNAVYKTVEDDKGNLWFGTNGGGVCRYDGDYFYNYTAANGLINDRVWAILQDHEKNLWFGTKGGVSKFDGVKFFNYTEEEGLAGNSIYALHEDAQQNLWFATQGAGICRFDGKTFRRFAKEDGFISDNIYAIAEDKQHNLWFASDGNGVCKYSPLADQGTFTQFTIKDGLSSNVVYSICVDKDGYLWFGTDEGGVCRYNGKSFTVFTEEDGIANNKVWSILQDKTGNIWLGTENGITKINAETIHSDSVKCTNYKPADGFLGSDALQNSVYQDKKGYIWWGTGKMLSRYDPSLDMLERIPPQLHLKNILINGESPDWRSMAISPQKDLRFNLVDKWQHLPSSLSLSHHKNNITFAYVGINYRNPEKTFYTYKLQGLDENWSALTNKTEAVYGNLPAGNYSFQLKAVNRNGQYSEPVSFSFTISPPWWETWWFRLIAAICGAAVIYVAYRLRVKSLEKRQHELEETVQERTAEVVMQKQIIEEKNKEVTDSINYSLRLQKSILPAKRELDKALKDYFILYKPKAVISGDFYWMAKVHTTDAYKHNFVVLAAVDCTGHGVPGALMSLLGNTLLNQTIKNPNINTPAEALDFLNHELPKNLKAEHGEVIRDGMDMVMCAIDYAKMEMLFSGANNSVYVIRNGQLHELKGDKQAISGSDEDIKKPFTNHAFALEKGDVLYLLTDGYADQFGGPKGKKFRHKQLENLLLYIYDKSMAEQRSLLEEKFEEWRGAQEQVDDVTIIGVRV